MIEPGARLGFHAPSLGLTGDRAYPAELVNKAFETALKSAEDIFAINLHEEHNVVAMNDFLYQRIITTRPESMYYIATVGDAVMANIDLSGVALPVTPKLINLVAMCDNYWAANEQAARPDYRSASEYFAEIRRGIYDTRNPREAKLSGMFAAKVGDYYWAAKFHEKACLATVAENFRRNDLSDSTRVRIYSVQSGADFGPGTDYDTAEQDVSVPRWYMLDPDTPIAAFAPGANASDRTTRDDFVKMAGFDLFGGDLPDGMLRPASAEACVQACIGRGGCDAVTWDRWNKICYLKSVERTRKTLYVLSKATTFVKAPQDQKVFRARKGVIRNRFRDDKGFRDSPYETRTRDNKRSCERACFTHDCLGYNWTARTRTCELFAEPDEYFDAPGVTAGFKQQDVLD